MAETCSAPATAELAHTIADGARKVSVHVDLDWGDKDLRDRWQGDYAFCGFGHLAEWATEMAARHDAHVLTEGVPPKEEPDGGKKPAAKRKSGRAKPKPKPR